jgi:hypothetical protein
MWMPLVAVALSSCDRGARATTDSGVAENPTEFRGIATAPMASDAPVASEREALVPQAAAAEDGDGYLNINSVPPSMCFMDGRPIGRTPHVHFSVKPGTHTVKFVNAEEGLTKSISVTVAAGHTEPAVAKL